MALPFFMACASTQVPTDKMVSAEANVKAAKEVGGANIPQAQLHIKLAEDQLATTKKLVNDGDNRRAAWMTKRADADAQLALALAREAQTRTEAVKAIEQMRMLQQQQQTP